MLLRMMGGTMVMGVMAVGLCWADSPTGMAACRDIADATARLACFDRAAASPAVPATTTTPATTPARPATVAPATSKAATAPAAPAAPVAPAAAVASAAPSAPALSPQEQFGLPERKVVEQEVAAGTRSADAKKLDAHITKVAMSIDRRQLYTLDNGQVWRQLTIDGDILAKAGDSATISRGLLGSYWLQIKGGRGCKVSRLQ